MRSLREQGYSVGRISEMTGWHERTVYDHVRDIKVPLRHGLDRTRQIQAWTHNALLGSTRRAQLLMDAIQRSPTATREAKVLASRLTERLEYLYTALQTREAP